MKPQKSKQEQSRELARLIQEFVESGGEVVNVPSGTSGNADNSNLFRSSGGFEPKTERTPLNDVVKTLEHRKQQKEPKQSQAKKGNKPKKRLIVDDFGDPVRWVWED